MQQKQTKKTLLSYLFKTITYILLLLTVIAAISSLLYDALSGFLYFTNQTNLLIIIVITLYILKKEDTKVFKYLSFITLISAVMTALIFHMLLRGEFTTDPTMPVMFRLGIQSFLTHSLNPLLYVVFYLFINKTLISNNKILISLIHPLIFFIYFLITGPFTNFYPYDFINVSKNGLGNVLLMAAIIIPIVLILAAILMYIKKIIIKRENK